ncbi:adhesion G-protein coupled receptor D1-like [Saccoglossus kowalevskii]
MTLCCCSVSVLFLIIAISTYLYLGTLERMHRNVRINLMVAMLLAYLLFLGSGYMPWQNFLQDREKEDLACMGIGIAMHFAFLAMIWWMFSECLFVLSDSTHFFESCVKLRTYYLFGWGIPFLVVGVTAGAFYQSYGNNDACWLDTENGLIWAFAGPAGVVFCMNIILLLLCTRAIIMAEQEELRYKDEEKLNLTKSSVKAAIFLNPVMGICWAFGYLSFTDVMFAYQFVVLGGLQGFLTFMFYVVWNPEIKRAWTIKKGTFDENDEPWMKTCKTVPMTRWRLHGALARSTVDDVFAGFVPGQKISYRS